MPQPKTKNQPNKKLFDEHEDRILDMLRDGKGILAISKEFKVSDSTLIEYINKTPERRARIAEARRQASDLYVDKAEQVIAEATDKMSLYRARELAHHYRWKAAKMAPKTYSDKIDVHNTGEQTLNVVVTSYKDKEKNTNE